MKNQIKFIALTAAIMLMPSIVGAQDLPIDPIGGGGDDFGFAAQVCELLDCFLNNSILMVIATVAIIFLGIGAFFGKVSWGLVIVIACGIVVLAGAGEIANTFFDGDSSCDENDDCDLGG